jgi:DNA-binding IclR family transcriptional regulator
MSNIEVEKSYHVKAVLSACNILRYFVDQPEWSIKDLSAKLGLHRSTIHRLLDTMASVEFIEKNQENGKYRLGISAIEIGVAYLNRTDLTVEAKPIMQEINQITEETVNLAIFVENAVMFVEHIIGKSDVYIGTQLGKRMPVTATADGKIFLAHMAPTDLEEYLKKPMPQITNYTISDPEVMRQELRTVRERGISFDMMETQDGIVSCAAPIRNHEGCVVAALSVPGMVSRMKDRIHKEIPELVMDGALRISKRIGYRP